MSLPLEITNLRQRSNLEQPKTKKITTTSACATTNAESSNSAKFIVGDSMTRDLKGRLMARDKAVKVYTFPGASCEDMERRYRPTCALVPLQILQIETAKQFTPWCTLKSSKQFSDHINAIILKVEYSKIPSLSKIDRETV